MTGVGYAAPLLFDVFGLLSGGEWFAEPHGDLEAAVVCRQSGCLASHICPDRDTLMIPRAAAAGEVCPYHRIVNLSRDLRYRVTADCYDPAQIVRMPMFILPPAQEWYYRKQHTDYRPLPPLHPGLSGSGAGGNPIDIVYPQPGACWWRPSRSKARRRVWSSRPYTVTATPCYTGISTTIISARRPSNTRYPSVPLPARTG